MADGHGLVAGAGVLEVDVDELQALAGHVVDAVERDGLWRGGGADDVLEDDVGDDHLGGAGGLGADVVGAVLLVDDDGVGDVVHAHVVVDEAGGPELRLGVLVRLDPEPVGGALDGAVGHLDVLHVLLVLVPPQAAHADAVPRPAPGPVDRSKSWG